MLLGLAAGMYAAELEIFAESQIQVPVDTATLKASGRVMEPEIIGDEMVGVIGYAYGSAVSPRTGRPVWAYALPVHERTEVHHAPPTKAKFLEDPALAYISQYEGTLAAYITRGEKMSDGSLRTWIEDLKGGHGA